MAFFTFCNNCGKKILIKNTGTKLKHFNGRVIKCSKCKSCFAIINGKLYSIYILNRNKKDA